MVLTFLFNHVWPVSKSLSSAIVFDPRPVVAEAVGTGLLVAVVVGSGVMAQRLATGAPAVALLCNTLATSGGLVALILVFGEISGAHFNPVVSLVKGIEKQLPWPMVGAYAAAQCAGGVAGTWLAHGMFDLPLWQVGDHVRNGPNLWLAESVATLALLLVVLTAGRRSVMQAAVGVGAVIGAGYWFTASTSFANPAVTLARAFTTTYAGIAPASVPMFWAAQLVGGLLAFGLWRWLSAPKGPGRG